MIPNPLRLLLLAATAMFLCSCDQAAMQGQRHPLVGAWLATDGTIFHFRDDRTFHGLDFRKREIWGNWVILSDSRIGFQSLLHDSFYDPQYAVIRKDDRNAMDYIVTGGTHFIPATRIDPSKADAAIELVIRPGLHLPEKPEAE